ncbi:hypothetical protein AK830_g797 [Neonectria ditissima]|uniref:Uncharacterized protein n=1 Tax=Neonectria ditissima TaxID=78410 RepID=A0A0P7C1A5_9HYPO|nr:hypothetical protein AK830_g797 [Neonectria ditissima]
MVTTRSQDAKKATASAAQHESAKSTATSKPHSARHSSKASHGRKQQIVTKGKPQRKIGHSKPNQEALQENEANREWTNQYYQGKSVLDFHGLGCGSCPLSSPQITFMSPFADEGSLEIMTGVDGLGTGGLRLVKGPSNDPGRGLPDTFMVPLQNVEQVILVPGTSETSKGMWQVVIVPTAATGTSAMVNKRPQMIQFEWPDRDVDELLKINVAENMSKKENATYLSILRAVLDERSLLKLMGKLSHHFTSPFLRRRSGRGLPLLGSRLFSTRFAL